MEVARSTSFWLTRSIGSTCKTLLVNTKCLHEQANRSYLGYEVIPYDAPNPLDVFSDPILRGQVRIIDVTEE